MGAWKSYIFLLIFALLAAPLAAYQQECSVPGPYGPLPDYDCDQVADYFDNCPGTPNPYQEDTDQDGFGDACRPSEKSTVTPEETTQQKKESESNPLDNTIIETLLFQEILIGERAIYPITVINNNPTTTTYHLSLSDTSAIGTYRLDPRPSLTLPPGAAETRYLYIESESFSTPGRNTLTLTVESQDMEEAFPLTLRILKPARKINQQSKVDVNTFFRGLLILIIIALIIAALIIAFRRFNETERGKKSDDEFGGYY